jgi:uncharacterized protein YecE (DUF72 family)
MPHVRVGTSGYDYPHWKGRFYPAPLPRSRWLPYLAERLDTVELNGTFYSLKSPDVFRRWAAATPPGFLFAVKGSRFITHNLKLRRAEGALANFYASGVLALGRKTGPFLWQLPDSYPFDAARLDDFIRLLPRTSTAAADLARGHDHRVRRGVLLEPAATVRYRHAFEVRHPSYFHPEFYALLRRRRCAFVIADTAGTFSYAEEVTAPFVYVRLHGSRRLYGSAYTPDERRAWAARIRGFEGGGRDVYVYFDNDARAYAARDAMALAGLLGAAPGVTATG